MKPRKPISDKAYRDFTSRLTDTFTMLHLEPALLTLALATLDGYLNGTVADFSGIDPNVSLALNLLRPEIDKCMARSAAARARAASRRADNTEKAAEAGAESLEMPEITEGTEPLPLPHLSRAERRAMERAMSPRMKIKKLG